MAIPANLELVAHGERPRSTLARLYLEHERLAIGGGTLVAVLLLWEALVLEVEPRQTGAWALAMRGQFEVCRNSHEQPGCGDPL